MRMYTEESHELIELTPKKAKIFLQLKPYGAQRPLRPRHVTMLANAIRENRFTTGDIATACLEYEGNEIVLMNGQHQCHAVLLTSQSIRVNLTHFRCRTPEDTSITYSTFDSHGVRTLSNIVNARAYDLNLGWPRKCTDLLVGAITKLEKKEAYSKFAKAELIDSHLKQGEFLKDLLFTPIEGANMAKDFAHLQRLPTVAAILLTWEKNQAATKAFFTDVRDGINLTRDNPAHILRNYLMTHTWRRGNGAKGVPSRVVTFEEMLAKTITAWNAFRRGLPTILRYFPGRGIPEVR